MRRRAALALLAPLLGACAGTGAEPTECAGPPPRPGERCVVAGPQYDAAGPVHRWLLGTGYRELWSAPIVVPVLDLDRTAGGLEAVEQLGHGQSATLALRGGDGRSYSFRSTDKDMHRAAGAAAVVPGISAAYRDQAASGHPGAPVVASALSRAAGVLEPERRLVVLGGGPRLGDFEEAFAGRLGTFEEYPTAGVAGRRGTFGALEIVDTKTLLERLQADAAERVDARSYLRARLVDLVIDDPDRHPGQWRFARLEAEGPWHALPEDRDLAFARFDGVMVQASRRWFPLLGVFDAEYDLDALTPQAVLTDPRLLTPLSREAWREEAAAVQGRLSPRVVTRAVASLPDGWKARDGAQLARTLRWRIRRLPAAAEALYERMAERVEIHATDAPEIVQVVAVGRGRIAVRVRAAGREAPTFERVLHVGETRSLRLCGFDASDQLPASAPEGLELEIERRCEPPRPPIQIGRPHSDDDEERSAAGTPTPRARALRAGPIRPRSSGG